MRKIPPWTLLLAGPIAAFVACSSESSPGDGAAPGPDGGSTADGGGTTGADAGPGTGDAAGGGGEGGASDAASGYDVKSIAGLVLWLDSEKGVTLSPAASAHWDDQSGNGNHAVKVQGCGVPDRNAPVQKGHASLGFHEYECFAIPDGPSLEWGTGDFFVAAVALNNYNKATGAGGTTFTYQDGSYVRKRFGEVYSKIASGFGPGPTLVYNDWSDQSLKIVGSVDSTQMLRTPYTFGGPAHLIALRRKGDVLELRLDGAAVSTLTGDAGAPIDVSSVGTGVAIGGRPGLTNFVGGIWEIVAVKGTISDADLASFETYAKAKYGL